MMRVAGLRVPGLRVLGLLGLLVLTAAAAPSKSSFSTLALLDQSTIGSANGSASVTAALPSGGFAPAPVPDIDLLPHVPHNAGPAQAELSADLFTAQKTYRGEGYLPGSTVQGSQTRHVNPAPGFSLKVPLE